MLANEQAFKKHVKKLLEQSGNNVIDYAKYRADEKMFILVEDDSSDNAPQLQEVAETSSMSTEAVLPLRQFITEFSGSLLEAVRTQNPPVYSGEINAARAAVLANLKRQPFAAQAKIIYAMTSLLIDKGERAGIINGDMGTGKSLIGTAVATLLHHAGFQRTLILCPPHLVYKWRREILETVTDAKVVVLNGSDTLKTLLHLKSQTAKATVPEFYIMGRVRLRLGHHWQPAFAKRRVFQQDDNKSDAHQEILGRSIYAACPRCGKLVSDKQAGFFIRMENFPTDKKFNCRKCNEPLWTLVRKRTADNAVHSLKKALCQLPTIGAQFADKLIKKFGSKLLSDCLNDNVYQLINLVDEKGDYVFSEQRAKRIEKAAGKTEFVLSNGNYQASEYIKRYLPNFFDVLMVDEAHEFKGTNSAQGQAMAVVAGCVKKVVLLTGTLMGGYADDIFFLLHRIMPGRMIDEGFAYTARRSLNSASLRFMENYGVLRRRLKITDEGNFKTARGKRESVNVTKAPGFGPQGVARFVLPYTAFLKLTDLGNDALPAYQEHFESVPLSELQMLYYKKLESKLTVKLREALQRGDRTLLGVVLTALLAWPETCFRLETVKHPRTKEVFVNIPIIVNEDEPTPKEARLIELCLQQKRENRRVLVYTIYTGVRDTAARLQKLLTHAGLKTAVLRSTTKADQRENWIDAQVDSGIDVLVCNPELIKTGLDLIAFPTIIFMQSGYSVYTLMQATRRSWRIGQTLPVDVHFFGYEKTAQMQCLSLMAKKIAVTQSTSGTMPDNGLEILNQDGESIEVALARKLVQ